MNWTRRATISGAAALGLGGLARAADAGVKFPFRTTWNTPWTAVYFDKSPDAFPFMLDTGRSYFAMDAQAAKSAHLPIVSKLVARPKYGRFEVPIYRAQSLRVGGVVREFNVYLGGSFTPLPTGISGTVPAALFGAMGLDFDAQEVLIVRRLDGKPEGYLPLDMSLPGHYEQGTAELLGSFSTSDEAQWNLDLRPIVMAELDGQKVNLFLDTGFAGGLYLLPHFVAKHGLWTTDGRTLPGRDRRLNGTYANTRLSRTERLKIANVAFAKPIVEVADPADTEPMGGYDVAGVVGMELLRRFNFISDPYGRRVWLRANKSAGDFYRYDRAGLVVDTVNGRVTVIEVAPGGPAERAGLKPGDLVVSWNGPLEAEALSWTIAGAPGSKLALQVERDGQVRPAELVLEELL